MSVSVSVFYLESAAVAGQSPSLNSSFFVSFSVILTCSAVLAVVGIAVELGLDMCWGQG